MAGSGFRVPIRDLNSGFGDSGRECVIEDGGLESAKCMTEG